MIRRPPRSTRTDTLFPTRRSSDLGSRAAPFAGDGGLRRNESGERRALFTPLRKGFQRPCPHLTEELRNQRRFAALEEQPPGQVSPAPHGKRQGGIMSVEPDAEGLSSADLMRLGADIVPAYVSRKSVAARSDARREGK